MFSHIELQSWRQFEAIDIDFHEPAAYLLTRMVSSSVATG